MIEFIYSYLSPRRKYLMRSFYTRFTILVIIAVNSIILAACSTPTEPIDSQTPIETIIQPELPTDTQSLPPINTQPPLPTDTQLPLPTDTQTAPPTATELQATQTESQPAISGAALLDTRCTTCHSKSRVTNKHKSQADWEQTVNRMVLKGALLTPEEIILLVEYLAENY
jgi:type IV secretory pathway VirB10-like protein